MISCLTTIPKMRMKMSVADNGNDVDDEDEEVDTTIDKDLVISSVNEINGYI